MNANKSTMEMPVLLMYNCKYQIQTHVIRHSMGCIRQNDLYNYAENVFPRFSHCDAVREHDSNVLVGAMAGKATTYQQ